MNSYEARKRLKSAPHISHNGVEYVRYTDMLGLVYDIFFELESDINIDSGEEDEEEYPKFDW